MVTHRMSCVLLVVALLGCTTDATEPVDLPTFEWPVAVSVTPWHGDPPDYIYDWTDGRADSEAEVLTVTRLSDPEEVVWEIIDDSGSGFRPVVVHGTVPQGATATVDVETKLTPGWGTRYRVTVELKDGQTGSTEFTT